jgi:hypothetical protein
MHSGTALNNAPCVTEESYGLKQSGMSGGVGDSPNTQMPASFLERTTIDRASSETAMSTLLLQAPNEIPPKVLPSRQSRDCSNRTADIMSCIGTESGFQTKEWNRVQSNWLAQLQALYASFSNDFRLS